MAKAPVKKVKVSGSKIDLKANNASSGVKNRDGTITYTVKNTTPKVGDVVGKNERGGLDKISNKEMRAGVTSGGFKINTSAGTPMITSQMGKNIVKGADETIANLSPVSAQPEQPTSQQGSATQASVTTPTTSTTPPPTPTESKDFLTYINPTTGQEQTLRGTAITDANKKALETQGYQLGVGDTSAPADTPEIAQAKADLATADNAVNSYMTKLSSMLVSDKELAAEVRSISQGYKARVQEAQEITDRRTKTIQTLATRLGARYTGGSGGIMGSIIAEEERQGLQRIEAIENDKQDAILKAKKAAKDQNFSLYAQLAQRAEKIQEKKASELKTLKENQAKQDALIAEEKQKAVYDSLIAEELANGTRDPLELYMNLKGQVPFDQVKAIAELLPKKPEDFTLSEGQVRFDANGNVIARVGKTYAPTEGGAGGGGVGSIESQYWADLINQGKAKLENVPEKLRSGVVAALAGGSPTMSKANEQAVSQAQTAVTAIDSVLTNIKEAGTFERFALSKVPGTLARDTENTIETVQALIGFDALAQMRAASPTGGALGSITEKELRYLQSVQGSLDPLQSTKTLKTNLETIRKSFARIRAINSIETTPEQYKKEFPNATEEEIQEIRARNTTKQIQENTTMSNRDLFNTGSWATQSSTTDGTDVFNTIGL